PATARRIVCGGKDQGQKASTVQGRNGKMRIRLRALAAVGAMLPLIIGADAALAQKSGGILKVYHRDNPPSASIHEEATNSTVMPFMDVYNNLVIFDQTVARQSMDTIIPDLGE